MINKKLAREVSADEAFSIMKACEKEGLVHMVDNVQGEVKHTCNCCGHYCWNVGIIARKKIPRDVLMAVYYIRETALEECVGCGSCVEVCPVDVFYGSKKGEIPNITYGEDCFFCSSCILECSVEAIFLRFPLYAQPSYILDG